VYLDL